MEWTAQRLTEMATGYWASGALLAAVEIGLFDALSDEPAEADALATRLKRQVKPLALTHLLNAMVAMGFVENERDRFALHPSCRALLSRESPTCMLDALAYNADLFRQWGRLGDTLVMRTEDTGRPPFVEDASAVRQFVLAMESKAQALAPTLAEYVDTTEAGSLLDVGAGPGTLSRRLAEANTGLFVTLADLPQVLAVAREINAPSPAAGRLSYHPADYHTDALPGNFDIALYAGALHQEQPDAAKPLFTKLCSTLRSGGTLYVIDILLDGGRTGPPFAALFQLNMLLSRPMAYVFSTAEVVNLLSGAGFERPEIVGIPDSIYSIVKARRSRVST